MNILFDTEIPLTEREFHLFRSFVREQTGIALTESKRSLLNNRLHSRIRHFAYESFEQYYEHLQHKDPQRQELQEMINALTTNMTSFFREKHHFDLLARRLLEPAKVLALKGQAPSLRLWSAGCSSGEEAYSLAMTVADNLERLACWDVKILATDIDTEMLKVCRTGIYRRDAVNSLAAPLVKKHFLSGKGKFENHVRIRPSLAKLVRVGRLNLMDDCWPLHSKFDAIFCRNVIIYFDHELQEKLLRQFARYLNPGGLFFAGHSENLFWLDEILEPIGHTAYRLRGSKEGE